MQFFVNCVAAKSRSVSPALATTDSSRLPALWTLRDCTNEMPLSAPAPRATALQRQRVHLHSLYQTTTRTGRAWRGGADWEARLHRLCGTTRTGQALLGWTTEQNCLIALAELDAAKHDFCSALRSTLRADCPRTGRCLRSLEVGGPHTTCEEGGSRSARSSTALAVWDPLRRSQIPLTGAECGLVFVLYWRRRRVVIVLGLPVLPALGGCRTWGALQGLLLCWFSGLLIHNPQAANLAISLRRWRQTRWFGRLLRCRRRRQADWFKGAEEHQGEHSTSGTQGATEEELLLGKISGTHYTISGTIRVDKSCSLCSPELLQGCWCHLVVGVV